MIKTFIIYHSVYGSTKQYAQWLGEELKGDLCEVKNFKPEMITAYDIIIIGSGLYAGRMKGLNLLIKHYDLLKDKKLIIYTCGLSDPSNDDNKSNIMKRVKKTIPQDILSQIKIFFLRGSINYSDLSLIHKLGMAILKKIQSRKPYNKMSQEEKEFIDTYGKKLSFTDKKCIADIIEYCQKIK